MPRDRLLAVAVLAALAGGRAVAQTPPEADAARTAPAICGPRCVEFVLDWYGRPADVTDLIGELQQGRTYQSVSLAALAESLVRRGIHTKAVQLSWGATLDWPHPVVRHSTWPSGAGHFTVLVPPRGEFPRLVWTDSAGYKRELTDVADGAASGVYLLTAPEPIGDPRPQVRRGAWPWLAGVSGAVLVGVSVYWLRIRGRRQAASQVLQTEGLRCDG